MFNQRLLKAKIIEKNVSITDICEKMGICESTFYRKITRDGDFSRFEIQTLSEMLHLTTDEKINIFFAP